MSLDFAIKDFIRKKSQTYPYVWTIALVIGLAVFMVNYTTSIGQNLISQYLTEGERDIENEYFFSGAINSIYSQFNTLILTLILFLAIMVVITTTTTLIISKKRDIAIMRALGTLPEKLYGYYLLEAFIIFLIGFVIGVIFGLISYGIFVLIVIIFGYKILLQIDFIYTLILFFSCFFGILFVSGFTLRKIGNQKIIKTFSKDIPYEYDAKKKFTIIPRWFSNFGFNFKIAIINIGRRKGETIRYLFIFTMIFLLIFTLGLGTIVLNSSSQEWIQKSQGEDIIVIGHHDCVDAYADMYKMYSDPNIFVDEGDIDFLDTKYVFRFSDISGISNIDAVKKIDQRLIKFCDVRELDGYYIFFEEDEGKGSYTVVGQGRKDNIPIIGVTPDDILQDFEIEGEFFDEDDSYDNMTIGDGLAHNMFDYPFDQSLKVKDINHRFHITGVIVDSFYSGNAGYIGLDVFQEDLNFTNNEINIVLLQLKKNSYSDIEDELDDILKNLGDDFTFLLLDEIFDNNILYLSNLIIFPLFLIIFMAIISVLTLFNYQKAGLIEKAKDFLIMKAIGAKKKSIKRILFLEALFIIIPALLLSLVFGMLINSIFLIERVHLPPLYIPFIIISMIFGVMIVINFLSLIPIMKMIKKFNIRDFAMY